MLYAFLSSGIHQMNGEYIDDQRRRYSKHRVTLGDVYPNMYIEIPSRGLPTTTT